MYACFACTCINTPHWFCGGHDWSYRQLGATTCVGKPDPGPPQDCQALLTPESSARCYAHSYTSKVLVHLVLNSALSLSHGLNRENIKEDTFIFAHGFRALIHG